MNVKIIEVYSQMEVDAIIALAFKGDMPSNRSKWNFSWKRLFKTEGSDFYKLIKLNSSKEVEGILMLSLMNGEMLYMNNIEVAPHNISSTGVYEKVAGCLIAFACLKSFELGSYAYRGYLAFESKSEFINLYQSKYGATLAKGNRMFIDPETGIKLIGKYLNKKL